MTTLHSRKSIDRSPLLQGFRFGALALVLACCALPPASRALLPPPPPDGGYPGANTAEGTRALFNLTTGTNNTATGFEALFKNTIGSRNTANGTSALHENIDGINNTATGNNALYNNQTGIQNTATGTAALRSNSTGSSNTAHGFQALLSNTNGFQNTANGAFALFNNTTGTINTALGFQALFSTTTGFENTATGFVALASNTTGYVNTAHGAYALGSNTTGSNNTADGVGALYRNTTGSANTASGNAALASSETGRANTAFGLSALLNSTGNGNIALGYGAGANLILGDNNIYIGNQAPSPTVNESDIIRIGTVGTHTNTFVAGISGTAVVGDAVVVDENSQLGTVASSQRFKTEIKPMDKASEAIHALKPVTFRYKQEIDSRGRRQFGLVAEEVEKVSPDLVSRGADGKVYTVRYEAVNAMLLNEFLKEHRKVEEQQAAITELKSTVAQQQKEFQATVAQQQRQIEALTAGLQKVSAQVEASKPAPHVVNNP